MSINPCTGEPDVERDGKRLIVARDNNDEIVLIERSETRDHLSRASALGTFFEVWLNDRCTIGDIAGHLTCSEVEALADLLAAHGHHDAVDDLRVRHVESDDFGDMDHNTGESREEGR